MQTLKIEDFLDKFYFFFQKVVCQQEYFHNLFLTHYHLHGEHLTAIGA